MHAEQPTLGPTELAEIGNRTLVIVGDDDEVKLEHALDLYRSLPDPSWQLCPEPRTACWWRSRRCASR